MSARTTTVHVEHPDDNMHTLCGQMQTRYDPVTTDEDFGNVDCLACLLHIENETKGEL